MSGDLKIIGENFERDIARLKRAAVAGTLASMPHVINMVRQEAEQVEAQLQLMPVPNEGPNRATRRKRRAMRLHCWHDWQGFIHFSPDAKDCKFPLCRLIDRPRRADRLIRAVAKIATYDADAGKWRMPGSEETDAGEARLYEIADAFRTQLTQAYARQS
ncbi:hypothetical protein [Oceanibaculum indicum]|uniref:Uncharacterized protein n=1 Tax=Oceanibaculum indicum P24 TaxID=1207063 RepID=K2J719_9PROT|nr:hypothetical protein [Oceanibaculum indicum]EKE70868.1 hypothetical protein P24_15034 [Oceanibaculum indicum P24]